jgi:N-acetyl-gamma-glutamyl-phosphate reductase
MGTANSVKVGIMGAAALSAGKLLEILARHPRVRVEVCVSESSPGAPLHSVHPQLRGVLDKLFDPFDLARLAACDVVFSCRKAGDTFAIVDAILGGGAKLVDLSADYRLNEPADFEKWYKITHEKRGLLGEAVYGLPELHRDAIRSAPCRQPGLLHHHRHPRLRAVRRRGPC